jgi:hypothetical protein
VLQMVNLAIVVGASTTSSLKANDTLADGLRRDRRSR